MVRIICFWSMLLVMPCLCQVHAADLLARADRLCSKKTLQDMRQCLELTAQAAASSPESYEANWKAARAARFVAEYSKRRNVEGWQDICARLGRKGMAFAKKAVELEPDRVEGHFYYGLCVGNYSDGVSIFTAIGEGLKGKARRHLEKACAIDKTYEDATPVLALGRFWQILPWPMRDRDKALTCYQEALELIPDGSPFRQELYVYLGELLLDMGQKEQKARRLLQRAAAGDNRYFSDWAQRLLKANR